MVDLVRRRDPARFALRRAHQLDRGPRVEYLSFRLAADTYAAPVAIVREILKPPPLTEVPRAPATVMGIISVRGQLVTVLDLRRRLHLDEPPATRRSRILLAEGDGRETLGLFVDEVLQVHRFAEDEIEHAAPALGGEIADFIAGIARPSAIVQAPEVQSPRGRADARARGLVSGAAAADRVRTSLQASVEPRPTLPVAGAHAPFIILLDLRAILSAPSRI